MNKLLLFFLLPVICFARSYGQTATYSYGRIVAEITKEKNPKKIYATVKIMSPFTGGDSSWLRSVEKNINQSIQARKRIKKGKYTVAVKFIADKNGYLSDIQCETDPGFGLCEDVIHTIKKRKSWLPAAPGQIREYRRG